MESQKEFESALQRLKGSVITLFAESGCGGIAVSQALLFDPFPNIGSSIIRTLGSWSLLCKDDWDENLNRGLLETPYQYCGPTGNGKNPSSDMLIVEHIIWCNLPWIRVISGQYQLKFFHSAGFIVLQSLILWGGCWSRAEIQPLSAFYIKEQRGPEYQLESDYEVDKKRTCHNTTALVIQVTPLWWSVLFTGCCLNVFIGYWEIISVKIWKAIWRYEIRDPGAQNLRSGHRIQNRFSQIKWHSSVYSGWSQMKHLSTGSCPCT